jgi:hypothetical protein
MFSTEQIPEMHPALSIKPLENEPKPAAKYAGLGPTDYLTKHKIVRLSEHREL